MPEKTDKSKLTVRNVTKYLVRGVVQYKVASITMNLAADYTRFEKDDIVVKLGAGVVGWAAGDAVEPYTDKLVDTTFDFAAKRIATYKTNRYDKKMQKETLENLQ